MGGLTPAVKRHDQRQANGDLRRSDGDTEEHEDLPVESAAKAREGHQREVGRVKHQLQRHVNDQQVAAHDHPEQAEAKQQHTDHQIMFQAGGHGSTSCMVKRVT